MTNFIKPAQTVQEVGLVDPSGITSVDSYTRLKNSKNSSTVFETSTGDFERNTIEDTAIYFTTGDSNPLISGLMVLDRAALAISGKRSCSTFALGGTLVCATPQFITTATIEEANDVILKNLQMREPIRAGIPLHRPLAIQFNELALRITKDVRAGNRVYTKYIDEVIMKGTEAMKEWMYK